MESKQRNKPCDELGESDICTSATVFIGLILSSKPDSFRLAGEIGVDALERRA
jgi:hypothetical protein